MKLRDLVSKVLTKWSADKPIPNPDVKTQSETSAKWNLLERDKSDSMLFGQQLAGFKADFFVHQDSMSWFEWRARSKIPAF